MPTPLPLPPRTRSRRRRHVPEALLWCAPLFSLGAVGLGFWFASARPGAFVGVLLVVLACLPVGWVLLSALWPARAERRCPTCGENALVRIDARTTHGLRCSACDWRDESASAWLLAEEEGPLEELVLGQRRPLRGRAPRSGPVDSSSRRG